MRNMKKYFTIVFISAPLLAFAQSPTHCVPGEYVFLNCNVGKLSDGKFSGSKVVSLCSDKKQGMTKLDYRFGKPGKVEMQYSAPGDGKFSFHNQPILDRAGVDALYFAKGNFTYALTRCFGMLCGTRDFQLQVFNGQKRVATLDGQPNDCIYGGDFEIKGSSVASKVATSLDFDETKQPVSDDKSKAAKPSTSQVSRPAPTSRQAPVIGTASWDNPLGSNPLQQHQSAICANLQQTYAGATARGLDPSSVVQAMRQHGCM